MEICIAGQGDSQASQLSMIFLAKADPSGSYDFPIIINEAVEIQDNNF